MLTRRFARYCLMVTVTRCLRKCITKFLSILSPLVLCADHKEERREREGGSSLLSQILPLFAGRNDCHKSSILHRVESYYHYFREIHLRLNQVCGVKKWQSKCFITPKSPPPLLFLSLHICIYICTTSATLEEMCANSLILIIYEKTRTHIIARSGTRFEV